MRSTLIRLSPLSFQLSAISKGKSATGGGSTLKGGRAMRLSEWCEALSLAVDHLLLAVGHGEGKMVRSTLLGREPLASIAVGHGEGRSDSGGGSRLKGGRAMWFSDFLI